MSQNNPPPGGSSGGGMSPQKATIIAAIIAAAVALIVGVLNFSTSFFTDNAAKSESTASSPAGSPTPSRSAEHDQPSETPTPSPTESGGVIGGPSSDESEGLVAGPSSGESEADPGIESASNEGWLKTFSKTEVLKYANLDELPSGGTRDNNMDVDAEEIPDGVYLRNNRNLTSIAKVDHNTKGMGGGVCERIAQSQGPEDGPSGQRLVVKAGDWVCVSTNAGRSALLKIQFVKRAGDQTSVTADVTVWDGPDAR